jgi:hypothetical protein
MRKKRGLKYTYNIESESESEDHIYLTIYNLNQL